MQCIPYNLDIQMKYEIDIELENMPPELYVETINDFIDSEMDVAIDGSDIVIFNNVNGIPEKKSALMMQ